MIPLLAHGARQLCQQRLLPAGSLLFSQLQRVQRQQHPQQQLGPLIQQQQAAGFAAVPSIVQVSARRPPAADAAPLVVKYPTAPQYYSDQRTLMHNLDRQPLAAVELPGDVFNVPVRLDILHQVVRWQRAKARQGTKKTKDRSEVRGGGRKPWQQKGSGRARQGSTRAPQWRGGGIVHGPRPRSFAFSLPKKVRRLGLRCALSAKVNEGRLLLLDSLRPGSPKTKLMLEKLSKLLGEQPRMSVLLVDSDKNGDDGGAWLRRAARNIPGVEIVPAAGANVYSILRRDTLIITKQAVEAVVERLRRPINRLGAAGLAYRARLQQRREQLALERRRERLLAAVSHAAAQTDAGGGAGHQAAAAAAEQ